MRTGENNLRPARTILYFQYNRANALMYLETLARNSLIIGHNAFGLHIQANGRRLVHWWPGPCR